MIGSESGLLYFMDSSQHRSDLQPSSWVVSVDIPRYITYCLLTYLFDFVIFVHFRLLSDADMFDLN